MPHKLIASPFLDGHLLLRPGARSGTRIPADRYEQLRAAAAACQAVPRWAADTAADTWGLPEVRGKGLGRLLWRAAMHWGQSHGADYQLLQTEIGGASDHLCRAEGLVSLGFVRTWKV